RTSVSAAAAKSLRVEYCVPAIFMRFLLLTKTPGLTDELAERIPRRHAAGFALRGNTLLQEGKMKRVAVACVLLALARGAPAQYPAKPIRLVVPFPAGESVDTTARLVGQSWSAALGQQIVVDNRGGAGGTIGSEAVAKSTPDGYTLLWGN